MGEIANGKPKLGNALLVDDTKNLHIDIPITQNKTSVSIGKWPGKEGNVTIVNTPDFKLFELKDDNLMDKLEELFVDEIKDANALVNIKYLCT